MDPRAVAERLRRGEEVSLSQLRGSNFPELENLEPKTLTEQLVWHRGRIQRSDGRVAPRDIARALANGELIRPDNVVESTPAADRTVSIAIQQDSTLRLVWTGPGAGSYDYVALYDREPTDPNDYLSSQWCWAVNQTNGQYTTGTSLKDLSTPYWVAYITNLNGAYRITTKKQLDLPSHDVFLTEKHESYYDDSTSIERNVAVLNWTNPNHVAYYDYIALYDHKPDDALGYLSQQWNWAVNRSDGKYQTTTVTDPVSSPTKYWLAYVSNVEGQYRIAQYKRMNYEPAWTSGLSGSIAARKLREVILPGSHDFGTCGITPDSPGI